MLYLLYFEHGGIALLTRHDVVAKYSRALLHDNAKIVVLGLD